MNVNSATSRPVKQLQLRHVTRALNEFLQNEYILMKNTQIEKFDCICRHVAQAKFFVQLKQDYTLFSN